MLPYLNAAREAASAAWLSLRRSGSIGRLTTSASGMIMAWCSIKVKLENGRLPESDVTVEVPKEALIRTEKTVAARDGTHIGTGTAVDLTVEVLGEKIPIAIEIVRGPTMASGVIVAMMTDTEKGDVANFRFGKR
jgi:hypothetical protein